MTINKLVSNLDSPNVYYSPYSRELFSIDAGYTPLTKEAEDAFNNVRSSILENVSFRSELPNEHTSIHFEDELSNEYVLAREYLSGARALEVCFDSNPVPEPASLVLFSIVIASIARRMRK